MSALADSMKGLGKAKITAIAVIVMLFIALFMVLTLRMSTGSLVPLYTGLSLEDSSKIVGELEKTGVPYEIGANGTQISVPAERVLRLRMSMAEEGLPAGGSIVGYEIFDRTDTLGSSSFVMDVNMTRALEGELARTINSLNNVESTRVHLVMPKHELFSREKEKPSAAVTIKMRGGATLEHGEVLAVTHLISAAVPGLDASRVTVVDSHGRLLARGDGDATQAGVDNAAEYRTAYENRLEKTLEDLVEKVIGPGKVRVQVAADINFDRTVTNSEKFDPDGQVARSTQSTSEKDNAQDKAGKDNVSVATNLPGASTGGEAGNSSTHMVERTNETTNYEISKTTENHITEGGNVKKLSVAVLVDGVYNKDADGKETYAPRTADEIKQLKSLVESAIGYDEKRGDQLDVVNMRFTQEGLNAPEESFFERFKLELQSIIQTLIIAAVAILAIMLVLRPAVVQLIKQAQTPSERVAGELAALETPAGIAGRLPGATVPGVPGGPPGIPGGMPGAEGEGDLMIDVANIKGGMKSSSMRKVSEIVDKYPEETMGVLRQWVLKQS